MPRLRNILLLASFLLLAGGYAHAQTVGAINTIQFNVSPQAPSANGVVTIEAQGVGGLGDASITWQRDGKTVLAGTGASSYTFTVGGIGSQTKISVSINSSTLGSFTKEFTFTPSVIHLIWEANTSAPPLYRGKPLYSAGSQVKVVALPQVVVNGSAIASNRLSYQWSVGGEPAAAQSGLGRSVFTLVGNQLRQGENVSVVVSYGGTVVGEASVFLPATNPSVVLYVQDPLRGILFDQALPAAISLTGQEVTLFAQPYNFANESLSGLVTYGWKLNNQTVTGPSSDRGVLTLRQSGSGQGSTLLSLELQNTDDSRFLQTAATRLQILFGQQPSSASSGFGI